MPSTGKLFADFLTNLEWQERLPEQISIINPYHESEVKRIAKSFCTTFYGNKNKRILILGINPGRFGAGITGIPFTDPIMLEKVCGIANTFPKKHELSSRFIYEMIECFGGPEFFYNRFLLSAVCPLGFLKGIKNYNYYDSQALFNASAGFINKSLQEHVNWNIDSTTVISLGKKNAISLEIFNRELQLFDKIITLEHPRYIMQYKLRKKQYYIDMYCDVLSTVV